MNSIDSTIEREARELAEIIWRDNNLYLDDGGRPVKMGNRQIARMLMDAMSIMVDRHRAEVVRDECADQRYREGIGD